VGKNFMAGLKRKRRAEGGSSAGGRDENNLDAAEIFRRHFESQFKPLKKSQKREKTPEVQPELEEEEWEGLEDSEHDGMLKFYNYANLLEVEIVEVDPGPVVGQFPVEEAKAFMVSF
jgi:hypothetical protein